MDIVNENKCISCDKVFTTKRSMKRHMKAVHEDIKPYKCDLCDKSYARKQHKDLHAKTCGSRLSNEGNQRSYNRKTFIKKPRLRFSRVRRISAFGGMSETWVIKIPKSYKMVEPHFILEKATRAMKKTIRLPLKDNTKRLNFTMSIHVIFEKAINPNIKTNPAVVLTTSSYDVRPDTNLDGYLTNAAQELSCLIEEYEGIGSGWIIDHLQRLDTTINVF